MKKIILSRGFVALVDDDDYDELSQHKWYAKCSSGKNYAARNLCMDGKRRTLFMHTVIVGNKPGFLADHISGDSLDNTRANLRLVTHAQNSQNRKRQSTNNSGYKGVHRHKDGMWIAQVGRARQYIGSFTTAKAAAQAYDAEALRLFGAYAKLNGAAM